MATMVNNNKNINIMYNGSNYPPTLEKLQGQIAFGLSIQPFLHPFVTLLLCLITNEAYVCSKFHMKKPTDLHFFCLICNYRVMPFFKSYHKIL